MNGIGQRFSSVDEASNEPRLSVRHLTGWAVCVAVYMSIQASISTHGGMTDSMEGMQPALYGLSGVVSGSSLAGLVLFIARRVARQQLPPTGGEILWVMGGVGHRLVFTNAWNNPQYGFGDELGGIFLRTRIGRADVLMLDNRYFRGNEGPYLGEGQMGWLEEQLLDCEGPFILVSCGTLWCDAKGDGKDSWALYDQDGRERIFRLIEKNRIPGVLLLSGDWHGARAYTIPRPSGYTFYEFEPGSLGARPGATRVANTLFALAGEYAFGEFTIDAQEDDPTVAFRLIFEDGTEHYSLTLTRSQLTPK